MGCAKLGRGDSSSAVSSVDPSRSIGSALSYIDSLGGRVIHSLVGNLANSVNCVCFSTEGSRGRSRRVRVRDARRSAARGDHDNHPGGIHGAGR